MAPNEGPVVAGAEPVGDDPLIQRYEEDNRGTVTQPGNSPTVGDLRKAGYVVGTGPDGEPLDDDELPRQVAADTPTPPGEIHLVDTTPPNADDPDRFLTPNQFAKKAEGSESSSRRRSSSVSGDES